jgi:endonuclease-8
MPEGPEIRREADAIAKAVAGHPLLELELGLPALRPFHDELIESHVTAVDTHGKAMLTRFACGLTLYSHNQLYGRWYVRKRGQAPHTNRSLRVGLHTATWSALLYSATDVRVLTDAELAVHPFLRKLGPDVLDPALTWRDVSARLKLPQFRGRALGALYLDQGFIAGIGNYLRSEILHFAAQHPARRPQDLGTREINELARQTLAVTLRAYRAKGVTNEAARVTRLKAAGNPYSSFRFAVFDRAGEPCYRCGSGIQRISVSSRRLYFCGSCQPPV